MNYYPDFFNDVFGPVMQPGSSSHTAGPCRLGNLANNLLKAPLSKIKIELDKNGSFAGTFGHMNEDLGMLAGAYGLKCDDEKLFDIKQILKDEKIEYEFVYSEFEKGSHPNAVKFILTDVNQNEVSLLGNSVGGGMVETVCINGIKYNFIGDCFLYCVKGEAEINENVVAKKSGELSFIKSEKDISSCLKNKDILFSLSPVLPVSNLNSKKPQLFKSFEEWTAYAKTNNQSLFEAAIDYEKNSSGLSKEEIIFKMRELREIMKKQTQSVYASQKNILENPFTGNHFRLWEAYEKNQAPIVGNVISLAVHYAFGVQALTKGVKLVPGPMGTGGGYLYSALRAVKETRGFSDEKEIEGLFIAAGVGAICYTRTNPTGEMTGCTGECGVCGAMAAAAITHMAGGSAKQVENAASLMLQAAIGWPCDPIPGGKNQPCISRVLTAVTMSIVFSDLALSGKDAVLPFHEVVDVADKMGKAMPSSLKCTSCGGTCEAPSAVECKKQFEFWHKNQD